MPLYFINEFLVESDVPLPADASALPLDQSGRDNVRFRRGSLDAVPSLLRKLRRQLVYDVGDGFLVEPPSGVRIHIDFRGRVITLDAPDDKLPVACAWAVHAGLGASTITHGGLPLHGAGLEIEGERIALMAASGAGKSTLSWYLLAQGGRFANDDLIPVRLMGNTETVAFPSVSLYPKLQRAAVERYGLDPAALPVADYGTGEDEYWIPLSCEQRVTAPAPLAVIFVLAPRHNTAEQTSADHAAVRAACLGVQEAAHVLATNLHATWLIGKWLDERRLHELCALVAARVPVYKLGYIRSMEVLPVLRDAIKELMNKQPVGVILFPN